MNNLLHDILGPTTVERQRLNAVANMDKVHLLGVDRDDVPDSLLEALAIGGSKFVVRPVSHDPGNRPKMVATVYNIDKRPNFSSRGGLNSLCMAASHAYTVPNNDNALVAQSQQAYKSALADPALPILLERAIITQTDKNMGPAICDRRWLDSKKLETIYGDGFGLIGSPR